MARWTDLGKRLWQGLGIPQEGSEGLLYRTTPVILLDDLSHAPSTDPTQFRPWIGQFTIAAAAGSQSTIQIANPSGSGKIVIVEKMHGAPSGGTIRLYGLAALLASIGGYPLSGTGATTYIQPRDNRVRDLVATHFSGANDAGAVVQVTAASIQVIQAASGDPAVELDIVLDEGQGLAFSTSAVNQVLIATFWGREVPKIV